MDNLLAFFDPLAFLLVWAGALVVVVLQEGAGGLRRAFMAVGVIWRMDPVADAQAAREALYRARRTVDMRGLQCLDRINARSNFISSSMARLAEQPDPRNYSRWASRDMDDREARHNEAIRFWTALADVAPAIGMVGTILGLVGMFSGLADPKALGGAMAMALLTTLYGLVLANMVAAPISQRLLRLSSEELKWQRILADRLGELAFDERAASPSREM